ncbi:MAG: response regulator [Bacteroidales bacterium]|nr:response regulator [Bacteroidales bacterium]
MRKHFFLFILLSAAIFACQPITIFTDSHLLVSESEVLQMDISSLEEDDFGYVWMGTSGHGVVRFDGENYINIIKSADNSGVSSQFVNALFSDKEGSIWVGSTNGVDRVDTKTLKVSHYKINDKIEEVLTIFSDKEKNILATTRNGVFIFDNEAKLFRKIIYFSQEANYLKVYDTKDFGMVIVSDYEVSRYNSQYTKVGSYELDFPVKFSAYDAGNRLFLARPMYELYCMDLSNGEFVNLPKELGVIDCGKAFYAKSFDDGSVLFLSGQTHWFWKDGTLTSDVENGFPYNAELCHGFVNAILIDSRNNAWFGTHRGYILSSRRDSQFSGNATLTDFIEGTTITCMTSDSRHVWMVEKSTELYCYTLGGGRPAQIEIERLIPFGFNYNSIGSVNYTKSGHLLVSTDNVVLTFKVNEDGSLAYIRMDSVLPIQTNLIMTEGVDGKLWIGGSGIYTSGDSYVAQAVEARFSPSGVSAICPLSNGEMAFAFKYQGLVLLNEKTGEQRVLDLSEQYEGIIIASIFEKEDGTVWLGTMAHGLMVLEPKSLMLTLMDESRGHGNITNICQTAEGVIFLNDETSLYRFDGRVVRRVWYASKGISPVTSAMVALADGSVVADFGKVLYYTADNQPNNILPKISLDVLACNGDGRRLAYCGGGKITLPHNDKNLVLRMATATYGKFKSFRYQWTNDGTNWIDTDDGSLNVFNLARGLHKFNFRLINKEGEILDNAQTVNVYVKSPWYATNIAYIIYILTFIGLIITLVYAFWTAKQHKLEVDLAKKEKEMQERLNVDNMDFFANISHEFRTPLTIIAGAADALSKTLTKNPDDIRMSGILKRNSTRMIKLVGQLLDFNKLDHDTLSLSVSLCDAGEIIGNVVSAVSFGAAHKGISLSLNGCEEPHVMWTDADKIDKIMYNLLSNALKYTEKGGAVEVSVKQVGKEDIVSIFQDLNTSVSNNWLYVAVKDTGVGVEPEMAEKLFGRFYRGASNKQITGTGIGLYYIRRLTLLHHGDIKVESEGVGKGATFSFAIPSDVSAYSDNERTPAEAATLYVPPTVSENESAETEVVTVIGRDEQQSMLPTIVVVDDDYEMVYYLNTLFTPQYRFVSAYDASTGYKLIQESAPDIVISDVMMAGMDGLELCRIVRENVAVSHIPFVLLTAKSNIEDQIKGLDSGADAYVVKPFNPDYLLALVRTTLENRDRSRKMVGETTVNTPPEEVKLSVRDRELMDKLHSIMEQSLTESELDLERVMQELAMSRTKLFYKIKALTGKTPNELFKTYKLNRALEMLKEHRYKIAAIADMTGFSSASHFTRVFKDHFGVSPSKYEE